MPWINQTTLEGGVIEPPERRVIPSGLTVTRLVVEHLSEITDLPPLERLAARLDVLATGPLGEFGATLAPGTRIHVTGSLNQRRFIRGGQVRWGRLELYARTLRLIE
jgi:primosomal replication protein N